MSSTISSSTSAVRMASQLVTSPPVPPKSEVSTVAAAPLRAAKQMDAPILALVNAAAGEPGGLVNLRA